jgi:hypothetical protein
MKCPEFKIIEARHSIMSQLPRLFAYIDYRSIGTHEPPRENHTKAVYESIIEKGYEGPAIAAFFSFSDEDMHFLEPDSYLEDIPYGTIGVADGHNRLETFRRLDAVGLLRSPIIPVQIVPAHNPRLVRLFDLANPHSEKFDTSCASCLGMLALIDACHVERDMLVDDITACFTGKLTDGVGIRIRCAQPDIVIQRDELLYA